MYHVGKKEKKKKKKKKKRLPKIFFNCNNFEADLIPETGDSFFGLRRKLSILQLKQTFLEYFW